MTDSLSASLTTAAAEVAAIVDPVERFHAAREKRATIAVGDRELMEIQRAVVCTLYEEHTWAEVGEAIGVSGSRAEAIAKGR